MRCFSGPVVASVIAVLCAVVAPRPATADDFGCKVILCLGGAWQSISECVPDVEKALHKMAISGWHPSCDTGGDGSNASYAEPHKICSGHGCEVDYIDVYLNGEFYTRSYVEDDTGPPDDGDGPGTYEP